MAVTALAIVQSILDQQSAAVMSGAFDTYCTMLKLPIWRSFIDSSTLIETEDQLRTDFEIFRQSLLSLGVNEYFRLATKAEFLGEDYIEGHYVVHALRNATPMLASYNCRMVLQQCKGSWRMIELESQHKTRGSALNLMQAERPNKPLGQAPQDDARRGAPPPLQLYQSVLDKMTDAVRQDAFETYCDNCCFPYTSHFHKFDCVLSEPEHVKPVFDMLRKSVDGRFGTEISRVADKAHFLQGDLICGYHTTHIFKDKEPASAPIKSRMLLRRSGAQWRLVAITNALDNSSFDFPLLSPCDVLPTHYEIQKRIDT